MAAAICLHVSELNKLVTCCLCNGLLKLATCLSCNHHFCMACIIEFTGNTITSCPKCDLPAVSRDAQYSPEFDKLVEIYKGLELGVACLRPCCRETYRDLDEQEQKNGTTKEARKESSSEKAAVVSLDQGTPSAVGKEEEAAGDGVEDPNVSASKKKRKRKKMAPYRGHAPMSKRVQLPCPLAGGLEEHEESTVPEQKTCPLQSEVLPKEVEVKKESVPALPECTSCQVDEITMPQISGTIIVKDRLCLPCKDAKGSLVIGSLIGVMGKRYQNESILSTPGNGTNNQPPKSQISRQNADSKAELKSKHKNLALDQLNCVFCQASNDSLVAGPMMHYEKGVPVQAGKKIKSLVSVHQHCAEWAPNVYYVGDTAKNLHKEIARGQKLRCGYCGLKGAVLGCLVKSCVKSYHYPCARTLPCRWDPDNYLVLCPDHVSARLPCDKARVHVENFENEPKATSERMAQLELGYDTADISSQVNVSENAALHSEECKDKSITDDGASRSQKIVRISTGKWASYAPCRLVLCGSGLNSKVHELLTLLARRTGARLTGTWDPQVTHLIIGTDETGSANRTLKFMLATLAGIWILRTDWLVACVAGCQLVGEEPFEVNLDMHGLVGGPKRARLLAASQTNKLFEGTEFYFLGDFLVPYKMDLQTLVNVAGGKIVEEGWDAKEVQESARIVIYNASTVPQADGQEVIRSRWLHAKSVAYEANAHVVAHTWLLDSIAASELQPL